MAHIDNTLQNNIVLRPGDNVTFHCIATNTSVLYWIHEYIREGAIGDRIELYFIPNDDSNTSLEISRGSATARLTGYSVDNETGLITLESQINITVLAFETASPLVCSTVDGSNDSIQIHVSRKFNMEQISAV